MDGGRIYALHTVDEWTIVVIADCIFYLGSMYFKAEKKNFSITNSSAH